MASIYIAGPMSGYPNFNFAAFHSAAAMLREKGWEVFNPAEKDEEYDLDPEACKTGDAELVQEKGFDFKSAYLWDLTKVTEADAIYMLSGWQFSPGAIGEHSAAVAMKRHNPNYGIFYEQCLIPNRQPEERTHSEAGQSNTGREPSYGGL